MTGGIIRVPPVMPLARLLAQPLRAIDADVLCHSGSLTARAAELVPLFEHSGVLSKATVAPAGARRRQVPLRRQDRTNP
jgi:hypothetical protein